MRHVVQVGDSVDSVKGTKRKVRQERLELPNTIVVMDTDIEELYLSMFVCLTSGKL